MIDLDDWIVDYNTKNPHQGKRCQEKTAMETFMENVPLAKEKILDMKEEKLALAAQSDTSSDLSV